ncbi:hypothetical protein GC173_11345 [bacterium]|nr:hypothetical protein [bacterium]
MFPADLLEWTPLIDLRDTPLAIEDEAVTVPATAPFDVWLNEVPAPGAALSVVCVSPAGPRTKTEGTPGPGQFSINRWGRLRFHDSDAGRSMLPSYSGIGSPGRVGPVNLLASHISAIEAFITARRVIMPFVGSFPGVVSETAEGEELRFVVPGPAEAEWTIRDLQIVHSQGWASTGATRIRISTGIVGSEAPYIEALVGAGNHTGAAATGAISVVGGQTLYLFVEAAGGHQFLQAAFSLHNS